MNHIYRATIQAFLDAVMKCPANTTGHARPHQTGRPTARFTLRTKLGPILLLAPGTAGAALWADFSGRYARGESRLLLHMGRILFRGRASLETVVEMAGLFSIPRSETRRLLGIMAVINTQLPFYFTRELERVSRAPAALLPIGVHYDPAFAPAGGGHTSEFWRREA